VKTSCFLLHRSYFIVPRSPFRVHRFFDPSNRSRMKIEAADDEGCRQRDGRKTPRAAREIFYRSRRIGKLTTAGKPFRVRALYF
jgi:hypothetical protein